MTTSMSIGITDNTHQANPRQGNVIQTETDRKQKRNKKTETSLNRQQHPYSRQHIHIRQYSPYAYTPIRILPLHYPRLLPISLYTRTRITRICPTLPYIPYGTVTRPIRQPRTLTCLLKCALYYAPDLHPRSVTLLLQHCHVCVTHGPALIPLSAHRLPIGPTDTGRGWGNYINYVNPTNYIN